MSTTALVCIFSSILNSVMEGWKYRSRELWKTFFCHSKKKKERKQTASAWNFLQPSIQVRRGAYTSYFKINTHCGFIFFEECFNPQIKICEILNEHTVNYHPSPSEHPLIFLWTPKGFISPEYFLIFFSNLYIPPWLKKMFQIHGVKITGKYICESKNWICSFSLMPPSKTLPQRKFFENLFFPSREREDYGAKIWPKKLNLKGSLVTSFDIFHHLQPLHFWLQFCCAII